MSWENHFNTDTAETFNEAFFGDVDLNLLGRPSFFGTTIVVPLDELRNAEIRLATGGTHGHYNRYNVVIVHKQNGIITSHAFKFQDYLRDKNGKQRGEKSVNPFEVIDYCNWDWHCEGPTRDSVATMALKIRSFIEVNV